MSQRRPRVHMMTSNFTPGDAIGNYMLTSARLWRGWGAEVYLYADHVAPLFGGLANPSEWYRPSGQDILWYHYSIYAENLALARNSPDFKVMDFHGVTPPELFAGENDHLERLCRLGNATLPELRDTFDACIVHSEFSRERLLADGYAADRIHKIPLCVDGSRFDGQEDEALSQQLSQLDYLLFVGRIVPQKDLAAMLRIFRYIHLQRPEMALVLVGSSHAAEGYRRRLEHMVKAHGLEGRVLFTGPVNDPAQLAPLFARARLLLITSEWETFCVPVAEALSFGTPAAVHDMPPLPETAGAGGLIIDKAEPQQAAQAILGLLADRARYDELSAAARRQAADYTEAALERSLLQLLRALFPTGTDETAR